MMRMASAFRAGRKERQRLLPLAKDACGRNKRLARRPTIDLLTPALVGLSRKALKPRS
jgi:hypothetical protein